MHSPVALLAIQHSITQAKRSLHGREGPQQWKALGIRIDCPLHTPGAKLYSPWQCKGMNRCGSAPWLLPSSQLAWQVRQALQQLGLVR